MKVKILNIRNHGGGGGGGGGTWFQGAEEFERASLPLPTIEENGGGVMAIVQRKTIDEVIAERGGDVGEMSV